MNLLKTLLLLLMAALLSSCTAFPWMPERRDASPLGRLTGHGSDNGSAANSVDLGAVVNLGMVVNLTGPLAAAGREAIAGAEVAIDQINGTGGIKGRQARLIVRDAGTTTDKARIEAKSLADDYKASGIIAPLTSIQAYAIARYIDGQSLLFTYAANAQYMTLPARTTTSLFQVGPSNYMEGKAQALDLAKKEYTRYFILGMDNDEARGQADAFKEWLKKLKPDVSFVGELWQPQGTTDYTQAFERAQATRPDMVYGLFYGKELVDFTRQAKAVGFFNKVAFTAPYDVGVLQELKREMVPGIRAYSRAPFFAFDTTPFRQFVEGYVAKTGTYPSDTATLAYEAVRVWAQVIATTDSHQWLDLLSQAERLKFEFLTENAYFRAYEHQSSLGSFIGETKWNDTYGFMTYDNLRYVPAEELWHSDAEVKDLTVRNPVISVGIVTDMTGELAATAKETVTATEVALDQINKEGGVLGRRVELHKRDSQLSPEKASQLAEEVIIKEKVSTIIGPVSSATAVAMTDVAKRYAVPFIFQAANSERLTNKLFNEYTFQVGPSTYMAGRLQALALSEDKYTRYYLLGPRTGAAQEEAYAFKEWMMKLRPDVKFVGESWLPVSTQDYGPEINKILAAKPEMVYSNLQGEDLVRFTRQAKGQKFFEQVAFSASYDVGVLQELKGDMPPGVKVFARAPFFASDDPGLKQFVNQYRARTSLYPSDAAVLTYQSVMLWDFAVINANSVAGWEISRFLGGRQYGGILGPRNIRAVDHQENAGIFTGYTEWSNEYGFMVFRDMKYLPPETVWRSPGEIEAIRGVP